MGLKLLLAVFSLLVLIAVFPGSASGQDQGSAPEISSSELEELKKWMKEDAKYLRWYKTYGNGRARVKIRHRPEPPAWLEAECVSLIGGEGILVEACALLKVIQEGPVLTRAREAIEAQRLRNEGKNTKWFERVHLGALWPIVSDLSQTEYGALVSTHATLVTVKGKWELNSPGLMFLSLPDRHGRRALKRATYIGMSYKLKVFTFPGTKRKFLTHLNISNARVMDGWFSQYAKNESISMMGFSFTVKE